MVFADENRAVHPLFCRPTVTRSWAGYGAGAARLHYDVDFPQAQTCCGQPGFNSGYWNDAKPLAERFIEVFSSAEIIVCPSGSCTTMVRNFYPQLLADSPLREKAIEVGRKVFEFSEFLVRVAKVGCGRVFPASRDVSRRVPRPSRIGNQGEETRDLLGTCEDSS